MATKVIRINEGTEKELKEIKHLGQSLDGIIREALEALELLKLADFAGGVHTFKGKAVEDCIFIRKADIEASHLAYLLPR